MDTDKQMQQQHIQNMPTAYSEEGQDGKELLVPIGHGIQVTGSEIGEQQRTSFRVNYPFLCLYALIASMGMFQLGYVYTAANQCYSVLDIKFGI